MYRTGMVLRMYSLVFHGRTGLILFGGGGTVLVCPTALLTQYTTLFEILSGPFLRIFLLGAFFEKGPFCEIIY